MTNTNADSSLWRQTILPIIQRWVVIILTALPLIQALPALDNAPAAVPRLKDGTPATYTSLKRFPQNLGGNFLALFSNKNIVPLLIGGAASGIAAPFDHDIRDRVSIAAIRPGRPAISAQVLISGLTIRGLCGIMQT